MTNPRYQHDILIMDRSGSISSILEGMQDGFREFIGAQGALHVSQGGELESVTASLWQFDDKVELVASFEDVLRLAPYTIRPRGSTALYDAVGLAVTTEGERLAAMSEDQRPGQVIVVIASDGLENWSKEWDGGKIRDGTPPGEGKPSLLTTAMAGRSATRGPACLPAITRNTGACAWPVPGRRQCAPMRQRPGTPSARGRTLTAIPCSGRSAGGAGEAIR